MEHLVQLPADTPEVRALCERLVPGEIPVVLDVETPPGAKPCDCVPNVERVIAAHGGGVQYGWQLWETLPGVMLEAEFHAVWVDPDGDLRDVTPKDLPFEQSVFLRDPALLYDGRQIDNVRVALRDDPLIMDFIRAAEQFYEVTNRGELADYHGYVGMTPEMTKLSERRGRLGLAIAKKYYAKQQ
jgi:hypothetical protein